MATAGTSGPGKAKTWPGRSCSQFPRHASHCTLGGLDFSSTASECLHLAIVCIEVSLTGFSFLGVLLYLAVAALAVRTGLRSSNKEKWLWLAVSALFLGFAAWRAGGGEALVQQWARAGSRAEGLYADRRTWQGPLTVAGFLTIAGVTATIFIRKPGLARSPLAWANVSALALAGYTLLRSLSFHPLDAILYAGFGPFHVNHVIDAGLTLFCGACALLASATSDKRFPGKGGMKAGKH